MGVGEAVVDVADDHPHVGIPLACRSANCGICLVRVESGMEALAPPAEDEAQVLSQLGGDPDVRLGCQIKVVAEGFQVVLRVPRP